MSSRDPDRYLVPSRRAAARVYPDAVIRGDGPYGAVSECRPTRPRIRLYRDPDRAIAELDAWDQSHCPAAGPDACTDTHIQATFGPPTSTPDTEGLTHATD